MRAACAFVVVALVASAQPSRSEPQATAGALDKTMSDEALRAAEADIRRSADARDRFAREIADLRQDGPRLSTALVETGRRISAGEERLSGSEARLAALSAQEAVLANSLESRREAVAEILAALLRLGRVRPPSLLGLGQSLSDDLHTGLLLGSIAPDLVSEARVVADDLRSLGQLRVEAEAERTKWRADIADLTGERVRLTALLEVRRERLASNEAGLSAEASRTEQLARTVTDLRGLSDALARRGSSPIAGSSSGQRSADEASRAVQARVAAVAALVPVPLSPRAPFAQARGQLVRPSGAVIRSFGESDGRGGTTRGISLAVRPHGIVTALVDGRVAFSGPFRSFGRLLILDPGGGYYVLLAGMERIDVVAGQFVLAGEPVGLMGEATSASAASGAVEAGRSVLYVEFRRDGVPIDPGPWWLKSQGEKVRG